MDQKNRLGILGGMGPEATQLLYQRIIQWTDASCDQDHIPTIIFSDSAIPDRTAVIASGETAGIIEQLTADIRLLEHAGCDLIAVPCNTSHYFLDQIRNRVSVEILDMPGLTLQSLADQGIKRAALLATDGTLSSRVYHQRAMDLAMDLWTPSPSTQQQVMHVIYDLIKRGDHGTMEDWRPIEEALEDSSCSCAILACTELSVFREYHDLSSYYADALDVLARTCVSRFGKLKSIG